MPRYPRYPGDGDGDGDDVIDLDELRARAGRFGRRVLLPGALVLIALALGLTTYYQVDPDEVGIIQRFGRYLPPARQPGPHFKLPFGIDRVTKVPVRRQLKQEFGFRTVRAGVRSEFARDTDASAESLMLTGDLNVVTVEWIIQYKIRDPEKYVFRLRDVEGTFRHLSEAVMRQVVGDHGVTEVLTVGREAIAADAKQKLQVLCDRYETGIGVEQLVLQDVDPPEPVQPSFNEVNEAIQQRERQINEAWAEYNRAVPRARGEAEQTLQAAEGYATERVNKARGDAERFLALQAEYAKAPQVTRARLYLETMGEVLPKAGRRVVVDEAARGLLPLLHLGDGPGAAAGGAGAGR